MDVNEHLQRVQGQMVFLASSAHGLERLLGRGAGSITFRAGRTAGKKIEVQRKESELTLALDAVWDEMCRIGMRWAFEPYKKQAEDSLVTTNEDGKTQMKLVFRNCMVRSSLFRYGHPQKESLCLMNHGLFCGLLENVYGVRANLEIIHAGENACIKLLTVG